MANWLGDLLQGGLGAWGYADQQEKIDTAKGNVGEEVGAIRDDVRQAGNFQPWGVKSGLGGTQYDPATGQMISNLSNKQQQQSDWMSKFGQGQMAQAGQPNAYMNQGYNMMKSVGDPNELQQMGLTMSQRAMQDPSQRAGDVYSQLREMQRPDEMRAQDQMQGNLFGSGRGGMSSSQYGGTPEQHAYNMARNEAMNNASYQSMGQAQQELMNQANMGAQMGQTGNQQQQIGGSIGNQMMNAGLQRQQNQGQLGQNAFMNQFQPYDQLGNQTGQGIQNAQLNSQSGQNMAKMLADLGLGEMGTRLNYNTLQQGNFGDMIGAMGPMLGGLGNAAQPGVEGAANGLWEMLSGMFT